MKTTQRAYGFAGADPITEYTLENAHGMRLSVIDWGARITHIVLPDGTEAVLGYDSLEGYLAGGESFGAVCGRYANRISGAAFTLNGETYTLEKSEKNNCLHGGFKGFAYRKYAGRAADGAVELTLVSPHLDGGFPGELTLTVRYALTEDDTVEIRYTAVSDRDTVLNLTNHSYFNLADSASVADHTLVVDAPFYTPTDADLIPTGAVLPVDGTVFDLRKGVRLGDVLEPVHPDLAANRGYDNNFVLVRPERGALTRAAVLTAPDGRTRMECWTTEPAVQVYTANGLEAPNARGGARGRNSAVCLECQHWPDAARHTHFPSPVLKAGDTYRQTTQYRFLFER